MGTAKVEHESMISRNDDHFYSGGQAEDSSSDEDNDKEAQKKEPLIDFNKMLAKYRERTEHSMPYTIMQTEDVMFLDSKRAVALEYIYYQNQHQKKGGAPHYI